jgi:hypothetical protein
MVSTAAATSFAKIEKRLKDERHSVNPKAALQHTVEGSLEKGKC